MDIPGVEFHLGPSSSGGCIEVGFLPPTGPAWAFVRDDKNRKRTLLIPFEEWLARLKVAKASGKVDWDLMFPRQQHGNFVDTIGERSREVFVTGVMTDHPAFWGVKAANRAA